MASINNDELTVFCGLILLVVIFNFFVGGLCTEYTIETWASAYKGEPVDIAFWKAGVVGIFLGEFFIPAAIVTLILSPVLL